MIRDLAKSANSFSWSLSLLTLKQGLSLLRPGQQSSGDLFAPMTQVAVGQLDESMKGFFRAGDSMQAGMVDMAFTMMNPVNWMNPGAFQNMGRWMNPAGWVNPGAWMNTATNLTRSAMGGCCGQASQSTGPQGAPAGGFGVSSPTQSPDAGWGSMPGNRS